MYLSVAANAQEDGAENQMRADGEVHAGRLRTIVQDLPWQPDQLVRV